MNARAHAIDLRNHSDAFSTRRVIAAAMLAILLLNATITLARADSKNPFPGTQNDFTSQCRALGGTPHREDRHIVSCTWQDGGKQTCDFNQKPNSCTYTPPPKNSPSPNSNVTNGTFEPAGQVTAADAGQTGNVLTEGSQTVNADAVNAEVTPADEEPAVNNEAPVQVNQSDMSSLSDFEEDGD